MRAVLGIVIVAVLAWCGYWALGARSSEAAFDRWLEERRAEGWQAEAEVVTGGFPYRFDTTMRQVALADPGTGLAWSAPEFQLLALAYQPNHWIAIWPQTQRLSTPFGKIEVTSSQMQASLVVDPGPDLVVRRANFAAADMGLVSSDGWTAALGNGVLAAERPETDPLAQHLGLRAVGFRLSEPWKRRLDPAGALPGVIEALTVDATVAFDRPWDRFALEDRRPQPRRIDLTLAEAKWGRLELKLAGAVDVDEAGFPIGEITVKAVNWREILDVAIASGAFPEGLRGMATTALEALAGASGNRNTLDVPLTFRNGRTFLGPLPIGAAPNLSIR